MRKLRYSTVAILLALALVACGGAEQAATESAGDNTAQSAAQTPAEEPTQPPAEGAGVSDAALSDESATDLPHLDHQQIAELLDDPDIFLLDVRNPDELPEQGAIEGYTLIPIDELGDRLDELPRDRPILTI